MKSASKQPLRKSRKQIRKEQRKEKKLKRSVQNFRKNGQTNSTVTSGHISDNKKTMGKIRRFLLIMVFIMYSFFLSLFLQNLP